MKKALSLLTVSAMAVSMLAGCGSSNTAATTAAATAAATEAAKTEAAAPAEAATEAATAAAAEAGSADLADKKVGVCIYQFSDNFMTLFRTELHIHLS